MGEVLNLHTNVRGHFGMVEQYGKHANHFNCAKGACNYLTAL